jgi:hypothetical protein
MSPKSVIAYVRTLFYLKCESWKKKGCKKITRCEAGMSKVEGGRLQVGARREARRDVAATSQ